MKFLIIRFSSIGDIVLTTPIIRCLKNQVEGAEVHYVTKKTFYSVLESNPNIDKIHILEKDINVLMETLKVESFDYIIDLHRNIRSSILKTKLKRIAFSFNKLNYQKWLMVNFKINRLPQKHIVDRYFEPLKLFDVKNDGQGLDYFIPEKDKLDLSELPEKFRNGFIGWAIGGMHNTKKLPIDKIVRIIESIKIPVVLLGGPDDKNDAELIANRTSDNVFDACGKYSINQSAWLVEQASLILTNDTGLMHIAAAFKKTVFSFWGNTIPEFGMNPYLPGKGSMIFEIKKLNCRPCSKIGYNKCPKKHFKCMLDLDENQIIDQIIRFFE